MSLYISLKCAGAGASIVFDNSLTGLLMSGLLCFVRYSRVPTPLLYVSWSFAFTLSSSFSNLLAVNLGVPGVIDNLSFIALWPNFCSRLLIIDSCPSHHFVFSLFMWNSQPKYSARLCWILTENSFCIMVANSCICSFLPIISISSTYIMIMHIPRLFSLNNMHGSAGQTVKPKGSFFIVSTNFFQNCLAA